MFAKHTMFAEHIFERKLDVDNAGVISDCFKIQSIDQGRQISNVGGYQSNDLNANQLQKANCFNLFNLIDDIVTGMKNSPAPLNEMELGSVWININNKGDWNNPHTHPHSSLAGVYHVTDTSEQNGQIHILRDNGAWTSLMNNFEAQSHEGADPARSIVHRQSYRAGTLILFPSHLLHYVSPNKTDTPRVTLSFNMVKNRDTI